MQTYLSFIVEKEGNFSDRINTFSGLPPVVQPTSTITKEAMVLVFPVCVLAETVIQVVQNVAAAEPLLQPLVVLVAISTDF